MLRRRNNPPITWVTPWSWALLERSLVVWTLERFPAFYGTRRFNTKFTTLHLPLSWARPIQSTSTHPTFTRSILILPNHLRLGLPEWPPSLWLSQQQPIRVPPVVRTVHNFRAFYGSRRFNTEFTIALHLPLSWARPNHPHHPIPPLQGPS
jgi:hypothetical protein